MLGRRNNNYTLSKHHHLRYFHQRKHSQCCHFCPHQLTKLISQKNNPSARTTQLQQECCININLDQSRWRILPYRRFQLIHTWIARIFYELIRSTSWPTLWASPLYDWPTLRAGPLYVTVHFMSWLILQAGPLYEIAHSMSWYALRVIPTHVPARPNIWHVIYFTDQAMPLFRTSK